jgi:hypothetical protein
VAELYDLIKYAQVDSGVCMCGDDIKDHNQSSGHSPVDLWDHAVEQINKEGSSEAFILRKQTEPCVPQSAEYETQADLQRIDDTQSLHTDDIAVDRFAEAMKKKLSEKRDQGYGGWNDKDLCPDGRLQKYLGAHLGKGDPVDIGNFAMMIWNRGESLGE